MDLQSAGCPARPFLQDLATFMGEGTRRLPAEAAAAGLSPLALMKLLLSQSFAPLRRLCLVLVALAVIVVAFGAVAQEDENRRLEAVRTSLDQIEQVLGQGSFDDQTLIQLQGRVDAARSEVGKVTETVAPRAQAIQTRLDQLGAPPAEGQPPESPELTQERQAQTEAKKPIDEVLKRASALNIQADQIQESIAQKRRDLFAVRFLARTRSILDPALWIGVAAETPKRLAAAADFFAGWGDLLAERLNVRRGVLLFGAVLFALVLVWPVRAWTQRFGQRYFSETAPPTRLRRSLGALWTVLITTAAPIAAAALIYVGLVWQGLAPDRAVPFLGSLARLAGFVAFIVGLSKAILAPSRPSWRLPKLSDEAAVRLAPYPLWIASLLAVAYTMLAFLNVIGVGLAPVMISNGVAAVATALILALALRPAKEAVEGDAAPAAQEDAAWFYGAVRLATWIAIAAILVAAVIGYISLAFFLANQMLWLGIIGAVLYILLTLTDDLFCSWGPGSSVGRFAHGTVGIRQGRLEQLCVLASGVVRVILIVIAVLLAAAPWGVQSGDVVGWIRRAFSGFTLGGFSFSPAAVAGALVLLVGGILVTRAVQNWLDRNYLPHTRIDDGLKNSIRTATGYAGVLLAIGLAVSSLGFGLERIALVAGALSVGIGFGLQSVVSNFVSGLILLAERPIKVGDWVGVGTDEGNVRRISVRSTAIELFDHSTLIIPNSDLITKPVRNLTHQNPQGVVRMAIGTGHEASVVEVRGILLDAAAAVPQVATNPPPEALITSTTDVGVQWLLRCTVSTPRQVGAVRSDLYFAVLKELQAKNIRITASPAV